MPNVRLGPFFLYPIVIPIVLFVEATRWLWRTSAVKNSTFLFPFLLGVVYVMAGLELAAYLAYALFAPWAVWLCSFFAFEVLAMAIFLPISIALFYPLDKLVFNAWNPFIRACVNVEFFLWDVTSLIGGIVKLWPPFWSNYKTHSNTDHCARWYREFLGLFLGFSALLVAEAFRLPIWTWIYENVVHKFELILNWQFTRATGFAIGILAAFAPLCYISYCHFFNRPLLRHGRVEFIYCKTAALLVTDVFLYTNIFERIVSYYGSVLHRAEAETYSMDWVVEKAMTWSNWQIPLLLLGSYLLLALLVVPMLGTISLNGAFKRLIVSIATAYARYASWANGLASEKKFLQATNWLLVPFWMGLAIFLGHYFGLHPLYVLSHALFIGALAFLLLSYYPWVWAFMVLITIFASTFVQLWIRSYVINVAIHIVLIAGAFGASRVIVMPLIAPFLYLLTFITPTVILSLIDDFREWILSLISKGLDSWEALLIYSISDRSSFSVMFGWLHVASLAVIFIVQYAWYLFFSGTSPLMAFATLSRNASRSLEWGGFAASGHDTLYVIDAVQNISLDAAKGNFSLSTLSTLMSVLTAGQSLNSTVVVANTTSIASDLRNATLPINETITATVNASMDLFSNSTPDQILNMRFWSSFPNVLGHYFIDSLIFLVLMAGFFILVGKLASYGGGTSFAISFGFGTFIALRHEFLLRSNFQALTDAAALEVSIILSLLVPPLLYAMARYVVGKFFPGLPPMLSLPFERLWALQQWMWRVFVRQYHNFVDVINGVWARFFGPPPPSNTQPLYQRPRRYLTVSK